MQSGKAFWTTGSCMTSPPLPTSCGPQVVPLQSVWAPVRPGVSVLLMLCASPSARPSPSHPEMNGMTSTLTWMLVATSNSVSKKRGSEHYCVSSFHTLPSSPPPYKALLLDLQSILPTSFSSQCGFLREGEVKGYINLLSNQLSGSDSGFKPSNLLFARLKLSSISRSERKSSECLLKL